MSARHGLVVIAATGLLAGGCGSGGASGSGAGSAASATGAGSSTTASGSGASSSALAGATASTGGASLPSEIAVIKGWSNALRRGDVNAAAGYFALPSLFADSVSSSGQESAVEIKDAAQARAANETLTCGSKFVSATQRGKYVIADFVLTSRPGPGGTSCGSGAGEEASTDFLISHGKIVIWLRAPTTQATTTPAQSTTSTTPTIISTTPQIVA